MIDMASGPIQYPEYLEYSKNYKKRHCVDLSSDALTAAQAKIGDHGEFHHGSFFDLPFEDDFFCCSLSLHTIYHMDADEQETAVRKLVRITKPGHPVIILYSNPKALMSRIKDMALGLLGRKRKADDAAELYFHAHPLDWWQRFSDVAEVQLYPWRTFDVVWMKRFFPSGALGSWMLKGLFALQNRFPKTFTGIGRYPMIVFTKT